MTMPARLSSRELAFAQYVAMHGERDPLAGSERVAVFIEASLTDLYKSAVLVGLRTPGVNELNGFQVLQVGGDATVAEEVIGPYWTARQQLDLLSRSSVAITPENYKVQFAGEVKTGGALAYIYDVTPKKEAARPDGRPALDRRLYQGGSRVLGICDRHAGCKGRPREPGA